MLPTIGNPSAFSRSTRGRSRSAWKAAALASLAPSRRRTAEHGVEELVRHHRPRRRLVVRRSSRAHCSPAPYIFPAACYLITEVPLLPDRTSGALAGKVALITGGGGGLGSAAAHWLARDGAAVVLMGRTATTLDEAAVRIRTETRGAAVSTYAGNARQAQDVEAAVAAAVDRHGGLDICVTTVGGGRNAPLLVFDEEMLRDDLDNNLVSAFLAIKYSVPPMTARGGGSIVCISSDAARLSWPFLVSYCAAKAALEAMVRVAADELGHLGIRVNAVRPGLTRTGRTERGMLFRDDVLPLFIEQKALHRTGEPDDVAAGIRYLAGPESSWVTGQSFAIDGGHELHRATNLEVVARSVWGDAVVDEALKGRIPRIER
jgi:NAD(P)-dependent dehydrogenase (short-subunit alcohol dehydrogenase family)